jgi:hypothetical protein
VLALCPAESRRPSPYPYHSNIFDLATGFSTGSEAVTQDMHLTGRNTSTGTMTYDLFNACQTLPDSRVLDGHADAAEPAIAALHAFDVCRHTADIDRRGRRMPLHWSEGERRGAWLADRTDNAAVPAGSGVATGTRIGFLYLARREDLLVLHDHHPHRIVAALICPDTRQDVIYGVDNIAVGMADPLCMRLVYETPETC